jgi:hypothetical protein
MIFSPLLSTSVMRRLYLTPDWSGVLWDFDGGEVDLPDLPLSAELCTALNDWAKWHSKIYDDADYKK